MPQCSHRTTTKRRVSIPAITTDNARLDIRARGPAAQDAVRVFHPNAPSYKKHEAEKKRAYGQRVREGVPSLLNHMGQEATTKTCSQGKNYSSYRCPFINHVHPRDNPATRTSLLQRKRPSNLTANKLLCTCIHALFPIIINALKKNNKKKKLVTQKITLQIAN